VGRAYGARDARGVVRAGLVAFSVAAVFGGLISLVVWPTARAIAGAYTSNPATLAMAIPALALSCLMYLPDSLQVVVAQALRARGDVWVPTGTHLTSYLVLMMPLAWWLAIPQHMGIMGIALSVVIASFVSAAFLLGRFWMLSRGRL
ncbi:MAG TPA: MATE family efflux transporter, partial [Phenylobacterium sp.]